MPLDDMVSVPGGRFAQGTPDWVLDLLDDDVQPFPRIWFADETPVHPVEVEAFEIDRHLTTVDDYAEFVEDTGHVTDAERRGHGLVYGPAGWVEQPGASWRAPSGPEADTSDLGPHPVVQVSWNDAAAYAAWAGKRLPHEVEWELAARGWTHRLWPWGDTWSAEAANTTEYWTKGITEYAAWQRWWADRCAVRGTVGLTSPVGSFPEGASPWGCHDMSGNVYEWTGTRSHRYSHTTVCDPAVAVVMGQYRVIRGGSWMNLKYQVRCTERMHGDPEGWATFAHGFRCARSQRKEPRW